MQMPVQPDECNIPPRHAEQRLTDDVGHDHPEEGRLSSAFLTHDNSTKHQTF
jgi:hypothetical protein